MYTQEFWDNIYNDHYKDAPWMDDSWKTDINAVIVNDVALYLGKTNAGLRLLDYGCGNGHMGARFREMGMEVDLADISSVLVRKLHEEFDPAPGIRIYRTDTPFDLPKTKKYDVVIAWNLFHHLHPATWHRFLSEFIDKMKAGGLLFISGWDNDDSIIKNDNNKAKFTQHPTWFVNDLPEYVGDLPCALLKTQRLDEPVPVFQTNRVFRYFVFKKQRKNKNQK